MYRKLHIERLRLVQRLGRRGVLLLLMGMSWILVGITGIAIPTDRFSSPGIGADTILQLLDSPEVNFLWVIAGSIAVFAASLHDRRVLNRFESIGWNAVLTMPLLWCLLYVWSFFINTVTGGEEGRPQGLYGAIVWALVSLVIMIMAGWPEEPNAYPLSTSDGPENETPHLEE